VLDCLVYPSNVAALVDQVTTGAGSIEYLIETPRMGIGSLACETGCFASNPTPDLAEGLGRLEIKAESLRFVACATSDLLSDASFNVENWLFRKVSDGFADVINAAVVVGDGVGKPMGVLHPRSGVPIVEVSPVTPVGQFTWQDLVGLKFEVPEAWWSESVYLMNQRTAGLLATMSDGMSRPLWGALPEGQPGFQFCGSRIVIVSQMLDVAPG
jgi:HK97 family phage major capsid protein